MKHLTKTEIEEKLPHVLQSPRDEGTVELIVRRPQTDLREELESGEFDVEKGLIDDNWFRPGRSPESQITIMNSRIVTLLAQDDSRRALAGDQLYVDLDLSDENLPPGTRLEVGTAILETTALPHNGCKKFVERFGLDAMRFVNSPIGKEHHLRGIYAKVVKSGVVRRGDKILKT